MIALAMLLAVTVVDGDTLRIDGERIRLLGIDSAEMPGHCRKGRTCAPGDPHQAKASLTQAARGHIQVDRIKKDRYGRTIAVVYANGRNLSCLQLERGQAVYRREYDTGLRIARECR